MKGKIVLQVLAFSIALYPAFSIAKTYRWVDENGVTQYTTTPPPESALKKRDIIGKGGRVLKTLRGPMTPEERAAYEKKLLEEEAAAKALAKQNKRDRNILLSYQTEEQIIEDRDSKLSKLDDYIESLEEQRKDSSAEYEELLSKAVFMEREGKAPSEKLKANLRSAKREFDDQTAALEKAKNDRQKTDQIYEEDIKRFRELKKK